MIELFYDAEILLLSEFNTYQREAKICLKKKFPSNNVCSLVNGVIPIPTWNVNSNVNFLLLIVVWLLFQLLTLGWMKDIIEFSELLFSTSLSLKWFQNKKINKSFSLCPVLFCLRGCICGMQSFSQKIARDSCMWPYLNLRSLAWHCDWIGDGSFNFYLGCVHLRTLCWELEENFWDFSAWCSVALPKWGLNRCEKKLKKSGVTYLVKGMRTSTLTPICHAITTAECLWLL